MKIFAILFICAAALLAQTAPVEDYQVSGVVVDHLTRRPLNHVLVQLVRSSKGGGDASAITLEDGRFTFLHVPKGKYTLSAAKRSQMPQGFAQSDGGYGTGIVVDGRQKTDEIVFTMRTDAAISGTVIGEDGEPVANAQVQLLRESVNDGEAETVEQAGANTNSSGQFHFGHLEAGNYYLSAYGTPWFSQQRGLDPEVYPVTFYGDTTDGSAARVVALPEGGSANLQINIHSVPGIRVKVVNQARGVQLFVPGPGGSRIPVNTFMSMSGLQGGRAVVGSGNLVGIAQPAPPESSMELTNLAAGRYEVALGGQGQEFETVYLANGSTLSLDSPATTSIVGKVLFEGTRPDGQCFIFLRNARSSINTEVDANGTFRFEDAAPGSYSVNLAGTWPVNGATVSTIKATGARLVHDKVEVVAGATIELTVSAAPASDLATLDGFAVRNETGTAGAMVLLLPLDLEKDQLIRRDQSDADGSFRLSQIAPGRYTLVAIDDGHDLAYRTQSVIKPYLAGGLVVTIPLTSSTPVRVPIQARRR